MGKDTGELRIDWQNHIIRRNGGMIFLSTQDWALLELLARQEGRVIASEKIARTLWPSEDRLSRQDNLKHYIYRLRSKLESDPRCPQYLQTVPGQGYRFQVIGADPADEEDSAE
jgi:two-component system KDP operon response regulator KdpE